MGVFPEDGNRLGMKGDLFTWVESSKSGKEKIYSEA